MLTFLLLICAIVVIGIIAVLFVGTGGIAIILVFGDLIIGCYLVYKIIKLISRR